MKIFKEKVTKKRKLKFSLFIFSPGDGIGRHAGLRNQCLNAWGFESPLGHHFAKEKRIVKTVLFLIKILLM